ncbi:MAG: hypothetical protein K2L80_04550, partial [Muribaculaceae bacterium]|nr:hypothetical protein [Muribaculaceae bacterium]
MKNYGIIISALCMMACSGNKESYPPREIIPLYDNIAAYASLDSAGRARILADESPLLHDYLAVLDCNNLSDSLMMKISQSKPVEVFTPDVRQVFQSLDSLDLQLGHIIGASAHRGLNLGVNSFAAVVWGRPQSIVFVDSVMLIALNHYLGSDYPGYSGMPAYRCKDETPQQLPDDMAESVVG